MGMKAWLGRTWKVTYTHDRIPQGMTHPGHVYYVKAPNEQTARMRAGMVRAASPAGEFTRHFYRNSWPKPKWTIVSIERIN